MVLPSGGFFVTAVLLLIVNWLRNREVEAEKPSQEVIS
jgi:hypothetical protein